MALLHKLKTLRESHGGSCYYRRRPQRSHTFILVSALSVRVFWLYESFHRFIQKKKRRQVKSISYRALRHTGFGLDRQMSHKGQSKVRSCDPFSLHKRSHLWMVRSSCTNWWTSHVTCLTRPLLLWINITGVSCLTNVTRVFNANFGVVWFWELGCLNNCISSRTDVKEVSSPGSPRQQKLMRSTQCMCESPLKNA